MKLNIPGVVVASVLLLTGFGGHASAADYPPVGVDMTVKRVTDDVYYVEGRPGTATDYEGFVSNAGFVVTREGVVVFDALGSPSLAWELRQRIREVTDQPVIKVIVSHYHADHIYGLQVFQDEGAEIVAPVESLDYLDSEVAAERLEERRFSLDPWVNDDTRLVRADVLLDADTTYEIGGKRFVVHYLGKAHSDGDMAMLVEPDNVLFSGDLIFEGRIPFVGSADTRQWLEDLEGMQTTGLTALVPGHGPVAQKPDEAIGLTREYLAFLREVMGSAVEDFTEFAVAYDAVDWSAWESLPAFEAANRINAYAVYLSMERESMGND
jgi:glyoxylase-like metal-dependent hydrolase (beta-lactamase superfamily II)